MSAPAAARPRGLIIAIDGPSGAGKSTAGRALAERFGYVFLDTGAMYRALALRALREGVPLDDEERLGKLAAGVRLEFEPGGSGLRLDGEEVSGAIRARDVTVAASRVSAHPLVRRHMVARQREMGGQGGVVLDGRDIGTAVFPDAEVKFFLDADPRRRALRRQRELAAAGAPADVDAIEAEIRARDQADSTRRDSPLTRAPDAVVLDTTELEPKEVVERMAALVERRHPRSPSLGRLAPGAILFFFVAPGTVAGYVPWLLTRWRFRPAWAGGPWTRVGGGLLAAAGLAALLECFARFVISGRGTPAPVAPTRHLVVSGLYRHARNPMYLAVLAIVLGQALLFAQPSLLGYAALLAAAFHVFVLGYEEPTLRARYGSEYEAYRAAVRRWLPRLRPWQPPSR